MWGGERVMHMGRCSSSGKVQGRRRNSSVCVGGVDAEKMQKTQQRGQTEIHAAGHAFGKGRILAAGKAAVGGGDRNKSIEKKKKNTAARAAEGGKLATAWESSRSKKKLRSNSEKTVITAVAGATEEQQKRQKERKTVTTGKGEPIETAITTGTAAAKAVKASGSRTADNNNCSSRTRCFKTLKYSRKERSTGKSIRNSRNSKNGRRRRRKERHHEKQTQRQNKK